MKPVACCTSVASIVSLFLGVEKKTWPISHFCDRVNGQPTWLLTLTMLRPSRLLNETSPITRVGPTVTTDRI